ncbi:MAG: hypothetical protein K6A82_03435 [Prevotella sp.]|nr:hypothetical protein [Prevotella sp.]
MKQSLLKKALCAAVSTLAATTPLQAQEIWGSLWSQDPDEPSGIYAFSANPDDDLLTPLRLGDNLVANEGCTWWNGNFYYINYSGNEVAAITMYYACNTDNFKPIYNEQISDNSYLSLSSYPDPKTGVNYGCFSTADGFGVEWAKMNYRTLDDRETICPLQKNLLAVVIDNNGQAYAVDEDGNFLKIDKETGKQDIIGPTGIHSQTMQAAAIDPETNKIYWTVQPDNAASGLYEIDSSTGKATLIKTFLNNEWFTTLHVTPTPKPTAPQKVADLAVRPDNLGGGKLSFTMPAKTVEGNDLNGYLTYYIINNGTTLKKAQAKAGSRIEWNFTWDNYVWGDQTFIVQTKNDAGLSRQARLNVYVPTSEEDAANGIADIETAHEGQQLLEKTGCYDLQGRKTSRPQHGIYIQNGRKVIVK